MLSISAKTINRLVTFEDVILGFRKHWSIKFQKTVKNVDQTTNQENKQINQH